jgi:hypothetical protein
MSASILSIQRANGDGRCTIGALGGAVLRVTSDIGASYSKLATAVYKIPKRYTGLKSLQIQSAHTKTTTAHRAAPVLSYPSEFVTDRLAHRR